MLVEHLDYADHFQPLKGLDELSQQLEAFLLALLSQYDQRRRRVRHARFESAQQCDAHVGIADPSERPAETFESRIHVVEGFPPLCIDLPPPMGSRQF